MVCLESGVMVLVGVDAIGATGWALAFNVRVIACKSAPSADRRFRRWATVSKVRKREADVTSADGDVIVDSHAAQPVVDGRVRG